MRVNSKLVCLTGKSGEPSQLLLDPGQTCLHGPTAGFFRANRSGSVHANLPHMASMRLSPGARLAEYKIQHVGPRTTLSVKFEQGGECLATFDHSGALEQLEGEQVLITCAAGELTVAPLYSVSADEAWCG
jgi:hypothetical protein